MHGRLFLGSRWALVTGIFALNLVLLGCGESYEQVTAREKTERDSKMQNERLERSRKLEAIARPHGANTSWSDHLYGQAISTTILHDALVSSDGRPVLLESTFVDIQPAENQYTITAYLPDAMRRHRYNQHLLIKVTCPLPDSQAREMHREPYPLMYARPNLVIVAKINEIVPNLLLRGDSSETDFSSTFTAFGRCSHVQFLKEIEDKN